MDIIYLPAANIFFHSNIFSFCVSLVFFLSLPISQPILLSIRAPYHFRLEKPILDENGGCCTRSTGRVLHLRYSRIINNLLLLLLLPALRPSPPLLRFVRMLNIRVL